MVKMVQNGKKWSKSPKMVEIAKNGQSGLKWSKMLQHGLTLSKMFHNCELWSKWSKMVTKNGQNGLKWSKMVKMVKNGGPDLKRAQRASIKKSGPGGPVGF